VKYEIKELSLGQILDQAITLMKNHFGAFFGVVAVTLLPFSLLQAGVNLAIMPEVPLMPTPEEALAIQAAQLEHLPIIIGMAVLALLIVPIVNASLIHIVANTFLGNTTSLGSAIGSAFGLLLPLYWTWFLLMAAIMGGMICCIIPGIIAAFWFSLATQVVVIEKVSGIAALKRSRELMRGNIGTVFVLGFVVGIISVAPQIGAQMIPQVHAKALASVVINCVMTVFSSAAMVVFYFSCRCKNEQFDLQLLAANVGIADAGPASNENPYAADEDSYGASDNPFAADD
jgi:hypothetical protein